MKCCSLTAWAELLQLQAVRIVSAVLLGDVVPLFTLNTGHGDLWTDVRTLACHGLLLVSVL